MANDLVINEFMASNSGRLRDLEGDSSDWVELRNLGTESVDLEGWYLSDDADDLTKCRFPSQRMDPAEHLLIFASGKDLTSASELHTNLRLGAGGEYLSLTKPDGTTVVSSYSPFPPQQPNVSYGFPDDDHSVAADFLIEPTPGATNSARRLSETIAVSHSSPTFTDPFTQSC